MRGGRILLGSLVLRLMFCFDVDWSDIPAAMSMEGCKKKKDKLLHKYVLNECEKQFVVKNVQDAKGYKKGTHEMPAMVCPNTNPNERRSRSRKQTRKSS